MVVSKTKTAKTAAKKSATTKKTGANPKPLLVDAIQTKQVDNVMYVFSVTASRLYEMVSINRRIEDKKVGYQRTLSLSRVSAISKYIAQGKAIPGAIVVSFDKAKYDEKMRKLEIPVGSDVGWVIDGQHRLAGAAEAAQNGVDIDLAVVAFVGLTDVRQVELFVTINREAKNVPTSLYLDLLKILPNRKAADVAKERAADIASTLRMDESSPFFRRIVVTTSPRSGELSLTNFVRKVAPVVAQDKGILGPYTEKEQRAVIANYFLGLRQVFPQEYDSQNSVFFRTVGFGALMNVLPNFFSLALREHQGFEVKDVISLFKRIESFSFDSWKQYGSGTAAESTAGDDLKAALLQPSHSSGNDAGSLRV